MPNEVVRLIKHAVCVHVYMEKINGWPKNRPLVVYRMPMYS